MLWGATPEGRNILIAIARYLAAHSPTERARFQTATIARRLHRGERLYEASEVAETSRRLNRLLHLARRPACHP